MRGCYVVSELKRKFKIHTDASLCRRLGVTRQCIQNWKRRKTVTSTQVAGLVFRACKTETKHSHSTAIRPIVEFYPIQLCASKKGERYDMLGGKSIDGDAHPYLDGLREELAACTGVYVFFDSRGRAIYVGKTQRQSLLREMKGAFNRNRGNIQRIRRVRYPRRRQTYASSNVVARQIKDCVVPLYELASYFSAYEVVDGMIGELEALLVRAFANDLLNVSMERFGRMRHPVACP